MPLDDVDFVVLASDGLWDVMSSAEVVDFVRAQIVAGNDVETMVQLLGQKAATRWGIKFPRDRMDNTTIMIVIPQLRKVEAVVSRASEPAGSRRRSHSA